MQSTPPLLLTFKIFWHTPVFAIIRKYRGFCVLNPVSFSNPMHCLMFYNSFFNLHWSQLLLHPLIISPSCSFPSHCSNKAEMLMYKGHEWLLSLDPNHRQGLRLTLFSWFCSIFCFCSSSSSQTKVAGHTSQNLTDSLEDAGDFRSRITTHIQRHCQHTSRCLVSDLPN